MRYVCKQLLATMLITILFVPAATVVQQPQQAHAADVGEWLQLAAGALGSSAISCLGADLVQAAISTAMDWAQDQIMGALGDFGLDLGLDALGGSVPGLGSLGAQVPVNDQNTQDAIGQNTETIAGTVQGNFDRQEFRECVLDGLVWYFANVMIEQITSDLVAWIDGGFEGTPAFVSDPEGFLYSVGNNAVGQMIYESGLNFLCEPFRLDVQLSLQLEFDRFEDDRQFQCTLTDVFDNTEDAWRALAGDFTAGGWDGWFSLTQNPTNNPLGAGFAAREEAYLEFKSAAGTRRMELDWGDGWHSLRDATNDLITMPGEFVQAKLDEQTNSFMNRLEVADDVNEIVSALVGFFVNEAVTGFGSLLQGGGGSTSGGDYLRDTAITGAANQVVQNTFTSANQALQRAQLLGEPSYSTELNTIITELDAMDDDGSISITESDRAAELSDRVRDIARDLNQIAQSTSATTTSGTTGTGGTPGGGGTPQLPGVFPPSPTGG